LVTGAGAAESPPAPGTPRDFALPAKETVCLDNGLAITFVPWGRIPKTTVLAVVRTGNVDEGENTWLADVAVEMLREGAGGRSAEDIARDVAGMGGSLALAAGAEQTSVGLSVLSEHAPQAVRLIADLLRQPRFPAGELPRVLANFERRLSVARAEPDALADEALAAMIWGEHPFARTLPRPGQLAGYGIEAVREFHARNFGARRTHLYIAGRFERGTLEAALREVFADWPAGAAPTDHPPVASAQARQQFIERPGSNQTTVRIAVPVTGPAQAGWFPLSVMNTLLGGSFISRITSNLREDKGYAYSPGSSLRLFRGAALWVLEADVTAAHTAAALVEINREIERLRSEPPPPEELRAIANYRAGL
ncbi:MAG: insulinase family protein, partial [Planctomycetes bacterium]|nr:insulinase family protein [Planctomycetota bacterium]